ncbi:MAG: hypothetical protein M9924_09355 [Rhizobiaceae bacterium]|nr:hypothetical protein [Rhizobiaceae bacterium]
MPRKIEASHLTRTGRNALKADVTNAAARAISDAEAAKREAKTKRLRAARLKAEAAEGNR